MADTVRDGRSTRWDPHRRERRRAIVTAAVEAIREHGPEPVTAQIAERAGIPRTHVYRHFDGRAALDRAVVRVAGTELLEEIRAGLSTTGTVLEVIRSTVDAYLAWVEANQHLYRFLSTHGFVVGATGEQSQDDAKLIAAQEISTALSAYVNPDTGAAPHLADRVAIALIGAVDATAYWWLGTPEPGPTRAELADDLADQAWLLINRALTGLGLDLRPDDSYPPDLDLLMTRGFGSV